jgi:heptosyltransferase-3
LSLETSLERILICRVDNLGDVVMVIPVLRWLKSQQPGLRIEMVAREYARPLANRIPWVDRVWSPEQVSQAVASGEPPPDAVFHLQSTRALLRDCKAWRIPLRVGNLFRSAHWLHCNRWVAFSKRRAREHESRLCWRMLRVLFSPGPNPSQWAELLSMTDWLKPAATESQISLSRGEGPAAPEAPGQGADQALQVLVHPCSNGNGRQWPLAHFDQLVHSLLASGHSVGVTGSAAEREALQHWLAGLPSEVQDHVGRVSLTELIDLIARSDCLVASGTGPLHLASAAGTHAVGIFPPLYHLGAERWRPIGPRVTTIQAARPGPCTKTCTNLDCTCMAEVSPSEVMTAVVSGA